MTEDLKKASEYIKEPEGGHRRRHRPTSLPHRLQGGGHSGEEESHGHRGVRGMQLLHGSLRMPRHLPRSGTRSHQHQSPALFHAASVFRSAPKAQLWRWDMNTINMVLCGLGGQGILFMTKVLAQVALDKGYNVMGAETHGMAQRGGSVVSHLRLGNVQGSLVRTDSAHFLLALEENEGYRNLPFLARGGRLYVNTGSPRFPKEEVKDYLARKEILARSLPATALAQERGAPLASNLALLGFFSAFDEGPITHDEMRATIERISPERFRETNLAIFDAGYENAKGEGRG